MKLNLNELSAFLGVEGLPNSADPQEVEFRLPRRADQLVLKVHTGRSSVEIEIAGPDSTDKFWAIFECESLVIHNKRPSKLAPHVEMKLAKTSMHFREFHLGGAPDYDLSFMAFDEDMHDRS